MRVRYLISIDFDKLNFISPLTTAFLDMRLSKLKHHGKCFKISVNHTVGCILVAAHDEKTCFNWLSNVACLLVMFCVKLEFDKQTCKV